MSVYSALAAGVSGLRAFSSATAAVADNIVNAQTVGYKAADTQFATLVADAGGRAGYSAGGVRPASRSLIAQQGLLQATSSATDIGLDGAGFFVVRDRAAGDGSVSFTRAGSFSPDGAGYLRNTANLYLQGWRLDASGAYANTGSLDALEPVRVADLTGTAAATTQLAMRANLDATTIPLAGAYAAGDLATGTVAPQFSRSLEVFDAQGVGHRLTFGFVKTGPNAWAAEVYAVPATDVTAPDGLLASGPLAFNPDGSLNRAGSAAALFAPLTPGWTNGAGSLPIDMALGSEGGLDGLTQFGSESALISSSVDGGVLGNVASVEVSPDGIVSAVFDDGSARAVFQLPVATFQNPDGLRRNALNAFSASAESGTVAINAPGEGGSGSFQAGALEASTVDLARELTQLITYQRAYSASTRVITTADEMLQELGNLKR